MFSMYSPLAIEKACGKSALTYARNKARGGAAGQKGTRYEDHFAIFKVAEEAARVFNEGNGRFEAGSDISVFSQILCFVDDLVLRQGRKRSVAHYQAKNRLSTTWGKGPKSLRSDFNRQLKLCTSLKVKCSLNLVVSSAAAFQNLSGNITPKLRHCAKVIFFPYENISGLLRTYSPFRDAFVALNPRSSPTDSDLLSTATLLLGTWADTGNQVTIRQILKETGSRGARGGAPAVRPLNSRKRLAPRLKVVLDAIPGFDYSLEKGFMQWRYGQTDSGCYRYACDSKEFGAFAKRQIQRRPKTYDDIEGELA